MREIYKYFLVALVSLGGVFFLSISLVNALFLDFLVGWIRDSRYPGYKISCETINGGLLEGFYIGGFRVQEQSSSKNILEVGDLYIRVDPLSLLERKLSIKQARLGHIKGRIRSLDDFLKNLGVLFTGGESRAPWMAYFKAMELREVYFFDLQFLETTELIITRQGNWFLNEDLNISKELSFYGDLKLLGSKLHLTAKAQGEKVDGLVNNLPVTLEMVLNTGTLEGQIAIQCKEIAIHSLIGFRELASEGRLSLENRLVFSMHKQHVGESASRVIVPGGTEIFYTLKGEGQAFFQQVQYKNLEARDLYLNAIWSHEDFKVEHLQANFLGSSLKGGYEFNSRGEHFYKLAAPTFKIPSILEALKVPVDAYNLDGNFGLFIEGDGERIKVEPIVVENLEVFGAPVFLQNIEIEPLDLKGMDAEYKLKFLTKGGSYRGGYVDQVHGEVGISGASIFVNCSRVPLDNLEFLNRGDQKIPLKGRLNLEAVGRFSFDGRHPRIESTGQLYELEVGKYPFESFKFKTESLGLDTRLTGTLTLPLEGGKFAILSDLKTSGGFLKIEAQDLDFAYLKHSIAEFPVRGKFGGLLDIDLYPHFKAHFKGNLKKAKVFEIPYDVLTMKGGIQKDKFELFLGNEKSKISVRGGWLLKDPFEEGFKLNELVEAMNQFSISLDEADLSLYQPLLPSWMEALYGGELQLKGNFTKKDWKLELARFSLEGKKGSRLSINPCKIEFSPGQKLIADTSLEFIPVGAVAQPIMDIKFSGQGASLRWKKLSWELLSEFFVIPSKLSIEGDLSGESVVDSIFLKPSIEANFKVQPILLGMEADQVRFDYFQTRFLLDGKGLTLQDFNLFKEDGVLAIHGQIPLGLESGFRLGWRLDDPMEVDINVPRTQLGAFAQLFPRWVESLSGTFAMNAKLSGYYPRPELEGMAVLDVPKLQIKGSGESYTVNNIELDTKLDGQEIEVKRLVGSFKNIDINLSGKFFPADQNRFLMKGSIRAPNFQNTYLKLKQPRLENTYLTGVMGRISGFATLEVDEGLVLYEPLMESVKQPSHRKKIPYFESFDFGLKVIPDKDIEFRSEYFEMRTRPEMTITFKPEKTIIDGHVPIKEGTIRLGRNDFALNPTSLIRFVPSEENILLRSGRDSLRRDSNLWESDEFQFSSIEKKLSMMWKSDGDILPNSLDMHFFEHGSKPFETFLNIRAEAEVSQRQITLGINGPLNSINYSLNSDDQTMNRDDLVRLLASKGVGEGSLDRITNLNDVGSTVRQGEDGDLISKQLSAQLEDQVLAKPFESLIHGLFPLDNIRLEPGILSSGRGLRSYRMGTKLSDDITLSHESEFDKGITRKQTRIRFKLDDDLGLIYERDQKIDRSFELEPSEYEKDVRFGFERRFRF